MIPTLRAFAAFLARPQPCRPAGLSTPESRIALGWMIALYLAGLGVVGVAIAVWARALHVPPPAAFGAVSRGWLAPLVVLAAPLGEEALFRGWLTGRPRALWLLAMGLVAAVLLTLVALHWRETVASLALVALPLVAAAGWFALRRRPVPVVWARLFPGVFYAQAVVFALVHLSNYPRFTWALVPMVLPQLWAGLVFGTVRMRLGLPAAMLAHATGNAVALGVASVFA